MRPALGVLVWVLLASVVAPTRAQVPDQLKCYKLKDTLKLKGTADLDSPQFGLDYGCRVSKARLFCVPASGANASVTNKATGLPIAPLAFSTAPQPGDQLCYKVKCPPRIPPLPDQSVTDQLGNRTLSRLKAAMLCVPAAEVRAYQRHVSRPCS